MRNPVLMMREILPFAVSHIMIVESDPDIATLLRHVLHSEMDTQPITTKTVAETLRVTQSLKPLLFLINYQLRDGDGIKLYDQLHQSAIIRDVPAIMISTHLHDAQKEAEERNILSLHIPTHIDHLSQMIKSMLQGKTGGV